MKFIKIDDVRYNMDSVEVYKKCWATSGVCQEKTKIYGIAIRLNSRNQSNTHHFESEEERDKALKLLDDVVVSLHLDEKEN